MWWECSECGGHIKRSRAPAVCPECGTAGVIFVPADVEDSIAGDPAADSLRAVWLKAGLEHAHAPRAV
jgi:predicted amidophosphoribosyltransferase